MTQQTPTRSFLKHSQPLLTKCLQAALIAGPVLLAAAPSEAITIKATVNGFTGLFEPAAWQRSPSTPGGGNSVTASNTALTLVKSANNSTTVSTFVTLSETVFDTLRPFGTGRLLGWTATGTRDWTRTGSAANTRYNFTGREPITTLNDEGSSNIIDKAFTLGESYVDQPFDPSDPSEVRFSIARTAGANVSSASGTGVIENFQFVAEYDVPGPLPVVGAAAAFAWSRRLRKRLNSAKTLA
jgi:hypothetical protein